jgi:cyclopropane-fatty-acyl-phospholipid synthase
MLEKALFDRLMRRLKNGGVEVVYPDGSSKKYGPEKPWFKLIFRDAKALRETMRSLNLGFGEAYMDGRIDIEGDIRDVSRLVEVNVSAFDSLLKTNAKIKLQPNRRHKQAGLVQHHYDLGNDFYRLWLDKSMTYSCAYFRTPKDSLEKAQEQKIHHLLRKLQLQTGQRLLDIGSGWGQLLIKAAQEYGVSGLGVTLSREQFELSNQRVKDLGLEKQIRFELANYQDLPQRGEQYDRVISVGMFEHVGRGNHPQYFQAVDQLLVSGGISVLHTISNQTGGGTDPWTDRYIFPGGWLPDVRDIVDNLNRCGFKLLDYESLRLHYAMTLDEWLRRFEANRQKVLNMYDEHFVRMWRLYLGSAATGFRYGELDLSQVVFSKGINNHLPLTREFLYK